MKKSAHITLRQFFYQSAILVCLVVILVSRITTVSAQIVPVNNGAKVSFTFDDGFRSDLDKAAPALAQYGYAGTAYITSSFVGKPNYMSWSQVRQLQNTYGWEIGGHTVNHKLSTTLSSAQLKFEIESNRNDLVGRGYAAKSFATPFGDYNNQVLAEIARNYESHRPFHDRAFNAYPYSDYRIQVQQVQVGVSLSTVKGYINDAIASGRWLVLVFHNVKDSPSKSTASYEYATRDLRNIASYVKSKGVPVVKMSDGVVRGSSLLPNGSFEKGLAEGWSTDSPAVFTPDNTSKGAMPESNYSIKINAQNSSNSHLFSPIVTVDSMGKYVIKSFINVTGISSQELGIYIDEYDQAGNWVSGQYKLAERAVYVSRRNVEYAPTSSNVARIRIQFIVPATSGITGFIDQIELIKQ